MSLPQTFLDDGLARLLGLDRLPVVVDIGANPIDGAPPYADLLDAGLCRLIGFEPQAAALEKLQKRAGPLQQFLPYVIGSGEPATLRVTRAEGCSSLLEPDADRLQYLNLHDFFYGVTDRVPVKTMRLDAVDEIDVMDFLKIDVQGGELDVFKAGSSKLRGAVMVQTEVSFFRLYHGQPTFAHIDLLLRALGFTFHCFADMKRWPISPAKVGDNERTAIRQTIEADAVYVRDWTGHMEPDQWRMLAFLAHHVYQSYDLALRAIVSLEAVGEVAEGAGKRYAALLRGES